MVVGRKPAATTDVCLEDTDEWIVLFQDSADILMKHITYNTLHSHAHTAAHANYTGKIPNTIAICHFC